MIACELLYQHTCTVGSNFRLDILIPDEKRGILPIQAGVRALRCRQLWSPESVSKLHVLAIVTVVLLKMTRSKTLPKNPRVIVAIDINCFYAQVEILKRPELRDQAVGVYQKHLVVTSNYVARGLGVPKMVPIQVAKKACKDIILIDGSDLAPYRKANAKWVGAVRNWGIDQKCREPLKVEKLGLDEVFLDVSDIARARIEQHKYQFTFKGHVFGSEKDDLVRQYLMVGSQIADEIRSRIRKECGLKSCGGVGASKLCAKLAVDMHKPDDQTVLLPASAEAFISQLPVRGIHGFGHGYHKKLKAFDCQDQIETAGDVLARFETKADDLGKIMGNQAAAERFLNACRGIDHSDVKDTVAPVVISSEDSFLSSKTVPDIRRRLRFQANEMLERLKEDALEHHRSAKTLTVRFRKRFRTPEESFGYVSRALPMPIEVRGDALRRDDGKKFERAVDVVTDTAMEVLREHAGVAENRQFDLSLVGVGAMNFTAKEDPGDMCAGIGKYFGNTRGEYMLPSKQNCKDTPSTAEDNKSRTASSCPVCGHSLPIDNAAINRHVDSCLSVSPVRKKGSLSLSTSSPRKNKTGKLKGVSKYFSAVPRKKL